MGLNIFLLRVQEGSSRSSCPTLQCQTVCLQPAGDAPPQAGHLRAKCWNVKPPSKWGGKDLPATSSSTDVVCTMSVKISLSTFWTTLNIQTFPLFSPECWSLTSGGVLLSRPYGIITKVCCCVCFCQGSQFSSSGWLASLAPPVRDERSRAPHLAD